jgi:hypothetical protein
VIDKRRLADFTKPDLAQMLEKMTILILDGIVKYDKHGFNMNRVHNITRIEQTPTSFQERFLLLMDILEPAQKFSRLYIRSNHPDAEYLFNFLLSLYNEEVQQVQIESSSKIK